MKHCLNSPDDQQKINSFVSSCRDGQCVKMCVDKRSSAELKQI